MVYILYYVIYKRQHFWINVRAANRYNWCTRNNNASPKAYLKCALLWKPFSDIEKNIKNTIFSQSRFTKRNS